MKFQAIADNGKVHIPQKSGYGYRKICSPGHLYHPDKVSLVEARKFRCSTCLGNIAQAVNWWIAFIKGYEPSEVTHCVPRFYCGSNGTYYTKDDFSIILDELVDEVENGRVPKKLLSYMLIVLVKKELDVRWGWAGEQWFENLGVS